MSWDVTYPKWNTNCVSSLSTSQEAAYFSNTMQGSDASGIKQINFGKVGSDLHLNLIQYIIEKCFFKVYFIRYKIEHVMNFEV